MPEGRGTDAPAVTWVVYLKYNVMSEDKNVKQLAEVDFCLRKYYQDNMAGILGGVVKEVKDKQHDEMLELAGRENPANAFIPASAQSINLHSVSHQMPWGSKTTDDMMQMAVGRMFQDPKIAHDMGIMAQVWKLRILEKLGEDKYKELSKNSLTGELAMDVVLSRLNDMMIEQFAKSKLPSGTMDYIVQKGFRDSLLGMIPKVTENLSSADYQVKDMVDKLYDPSTGTRIAGTALSFAIDAPTLLVGGGVAAKGTIVAIDLGFRAYNTYDEYKNARRSSQEEFSKLFFGDVKGLEQVVSEGRKVNGGESDAVGVINSKLINKMRLSFNQRNAKSNTGQFIALCEGNGSYCNELVTTFLTEKGLAYLPQKKVPDWMMKKCSEDVCIKNAGYYLSIADEMNKKGLNHIKVGSKDMTMKQIVQQAYDYSRAADLKHQSGPLSETDRLVERMNGNEAYMRSVGLIPGDQTDKGNRQLDVTDSLILKQIRSALHKNGLAYVPEKPWPKWMDAMSYDKLEYEAKRWRNLAVQMQSRKRTEQVFEGIGKMSLQDVSQRAYDYARAADMKYKADREQELSLKEKEVEWDRNMEALNASLATPADRQTAGSFVHQAVDVHYDESDQESFRRSYEQRYGRSFAPVGDAGAGVASMSPGSLGGWKNILNGLGLDGMGDMMNNLGSTISMLPDLMVGMFTGKLKGFTLKDNMLPVALLAASLLFGRRMNPLLKLMFLGFGGALLLNNANKALKGEPLGEARRPSYYRRYDDEPLNPRLSNVQIKGNTILASIDGVPTVLTIKSDRVLDAYNKGAIPLNTLCNAVLRNYDRMEVRSSESYERVAAQQMEDQQQQVRIR